MRRTHELRVVRYKLRVIRGQISRVNKAGTDFRRSCILIFNIPDLRGGPGAIRGIFLLRLHRCRPPISGSKLWIVASFAGSPTVIRAVGSAVSRRRAPEPRPEMRRNSDAIHSGRFQPRSLELLAFSTSHSSKNRFSPHIAFFG